MMSEEGYQCLAVSIEWDFAVVEISGMF